MFSICCSNRPSELRTLILEQGTCVHARGEASRMAKDGFKTMSEIVAENERFRGNVSDAEISLRVLKMNSRWFEDVW